MTVPRTLLQQAKTKFDLTEPGDRESLAALTEALLALPDLSLDARWGSRVSACRQAGALDPRDSARRGGLARSSWSRILTIVFWS